MKIRNLIILASIVSGSMAAAGLPTANHAISTYGDAMTAATPVPVRFRFSNDEYDGVPTVRSEPEWKEILSPFEYYILRQEGTEKAYTGSLLKNKRRGTYHCAACGLAVFSSVAKYESDTGWPSFFKPIFKKNVSEKVDKSLADEERIEIECSRCGSHLGHVFDDGPEPTGLRYCINSAALRFKAAK